LRQWSYRGREGTIQKSNIVSGREWGWSGVGVEEFRGVCMRIVFSAGQAPYRYESHLQRQRFLESDLVLAMQLCITSAERERE
jgi:hypothetical protein